MLANKEPILFNICIQEEAIKDGSLNPTNKSKEMRDSILLEITAQASTSQQSLPRVPSKSSKQFSAIVQIKDGSLCASRTISISCSQSPINSIA